jgi:hypothetical protein
MVAIQTQDLIGAALDWAVAKAEGLLDLDIFLGNKMVCKAVVLGVEPPRSFDMRAGLDYRPSTAWAQGGPIIEREKIDTAYSVDGWYATMYWRGLDVIPAGAAGDSFRCGGDGPTPLIAAMRCYVASKLGPTVEVPEELVQ